jgi:hypothetical protein
MLTQGGESFMHKRCELALDIIIIIPSSHSINAIGPAPHRSGNNREALDKLVPRKKDPAIAEHHPVALHAPMRINSSGMTKAAAGAATPSNS